MEQEARQSLISACTKMLNNAGHSTVCRLYSASMAKLIFFRIEEIFVDKMQKWRA